MITGARYERQEKRVPRDHDASPMTGFIGQKSDAEDFVRLCALLCVIVHKCSPLCDFDRVCSLLCDFERLRAFLCAFDRLCASLCDFVQGAT